MKNKNLKRVGDHPILEEKKNPGGEGKKKTRMLWKVTLYNMGREGAVKPRITRGTKGRGGDAELGDNETLT